MLTTKENVPVATAVLARAIARNFATVIVIGIDADDGAQFNAGTTSDPDKLRAMLKQFKADLKL